MIKKFEEYFIGKRKELTVGDIVGAMEVMVDALADSVNSLTEKVEEMEKKLEFMQRVDKEFAKSWQAERKEMADNL